MGRYGAGTKNKDGCGFWEKDGFGDCQYLFQEEKLTQGDE